MLTRMSNWQVKHMPQCNETETLLVEACAAIMAFVALWAAITIWDRTHQFVLAFVLGIAVWFVLFLLSGMLVLEIYGRYSKNKRTTD